MKTMKLLLCFISFVLYFILITCSDSDNDDESESGTLDISFNGTGYVIHHNAAGGSGDEWGFSVCVDSNNRILVTGKSENASGNDDMVVWRYNSDGTLDTTFNSPYGFIVNDGTAGGSGTDSGYSMIIDNNNRILIAGSSCNSNGDSDMVIWCYHSDGTLATDSFNNPNGYIFHNGAGGINSSDYGFGIALDSNNKIIVAGYSEGNMIIWRYNSDGTPDTSFNNPDGYVSYSGAAGGSFDIGQAVTIDGNGKILVTGNSMNVDGDDDMVIWRYNSDGTLDTAFNNPNGFVVHNSAAGGNAYDCGLFIAVDSNGKILVTGPSNNGSNNDMVIWRYNSDGTLDASFNGTGYVIHQNTAGGNGMEYANSMIIDSNGRILTAGGSTGESNYDMVIWRYNSDGTLDTSFNGIGYTVHNNAAGGNGHDEGHAITLDSDGRIIVSGYSSDNGTNIDMAVWRYHN